MKKYSEDKLIRILEDIVVALPTPLKHLRFLRRLRILWQDYLRTQKIRKLLSAFSNVDNFLKHTEKRDYCRLTVYHRQSASIRRHVFESLFKSLGMNLQNVAFLEIGPGTVLKGLLRRIDSNLICHNIPA